MVHLRDRSGGRNAAGGVRHRTRRWARRGAQPDASSDTGGAPRVGAPVGLVSGGRSSDGEHPRPAGPAPRGRRPGGEGPSGGDTGVTQVGIPAAGDPTRCELGDDMHSGNRCTTVSGLPVRSPTRVSRRMVAMIRWYQRGAEGRPSPCRFYPSCSSYAHEAIEVHGSVRGIWLSARRLLRCRPFGPSGVDLVPLPRGLTEHGAERSMSTHDHCTT